MRHNINIFLSYLYNRIYAIYRNVVPWYRFHPSRFLFTYWFTYTPCPQSFFARHANTRQWYVIIRLRVCRTLSIDISQNTRNALASAAGISESESKKYLSHWYTVNDMGKWGRYNRTRLSIHLDIMPHICLILDISLFLGDMNESHIYTVVLTLW